MSDVLNTLETLESACIDDLNKKQESGQKKYKFNKLKMYFGDDYEIAGVKISQPTINDIIELGEERFYTGLSPFLYNSTSIRVMLWDRKTDWNKVKDIEVFDILNHIVEDKEPLSLFFHDIKFNDFEIVKIKQDNIESLALQSESQKILWKEDEFLEIAEYIREVLNRHPKVEKAVGKTAKQWMIQDDRMKAQQENKEDTQSLLSLISACINHPGFKYKLEELRQVHIYQFLDSVKRIQKYEYATAAIKGLYSGFVDSKSIKQESLEFMGDI